jgi:nucleotide-binding universal stress UspA family protein
MAGARFRSILAASDLGPASDEVVGSAAALAERLGAALHVLHALELELLPPLEAPTFPGRIRQAEEALAGQARRVAPSLRPASLQVVDYAAHRAIEARAAEVSADLVVVGPHRGGEVGARFLGTTADRVIRTAAVPSLVARGALTVPIRRIGVPTDFSAPARGALDLALALAGPLGGDAGGGGPELLVFHIAWHVERQDGPALEEPELRSRVEREAADAVDRAGADPSPHVPTEVVRGVSPAEAIGSYAREHGLELLVLGTHGHGGLRRFLIGSVASGAARQAPCPVLLVPPRFEA